MTAPTSPSMTPGEREMKYRKKPVVIEAWQWNESIATMEMLRKRGMKWTGHRGHRDHPDLCYDLRIKTLEGTMLVNPGDWIIRGVKGEFYNCKPDIFDETYEPASAPSPAQPTAGDVGQWLPKTEAWKALPDREMLKRIGFEFVGTERAAYEQADLLIAAGFQRTIPTADARETARVWLENHTREGAYDKDVESLAALLSAVEQETIERCLKVVTTVTGKHPSNRPHALEIYKGIEAIRAQGGGRA